MLVCGQEEPLQVNEQLHALAEETGVINLSHIEEQRLNRYSFVWLGESSEAKSMFSLLVQNILDSSHMTATWVLIWQNHTQGDERMKSLWLLSKRQKEGWVMYQDETLAIASKSATDVGLNAYEPPAFSWRDGGLLLFLGMVPSPEALGSDPARPSLEVFAQRMRLAPSKQFLTWLADHHYSVAYREQDDLGRLALIIVSTSRFDTTTLHTRGIIKEIKAGIEAGDVWRYP